LAKPTSSTRSALPRTTPIPPFASAAANIMFEILNPGFAADRSPHGSDRFVVPLRGNA
jgi:hypothetical protein